MHRLTKQAIEQFQREILSWYAKNKRYLPWRRDRDPYHILVSEVMLQQTQVARVIPKYETWLKAFPTIDALVMASKRDVLQLWSGLGYNSRALYLREAAKMIVSLSSSRNRGSDSHLREKDASYFPHSIEELRKLPGVGDYTARAIACFAFDQQIAVVDTNVRKAILLHFSPHPNPLPQGERELSSLLRGEGKDEGEMTEKQIQSIGY